MIRAFYLTCLLAFCLPLSRLSAQLNNNLLENPVALNDSMHESFGLALYDNFFFKNNEYFDSIAQGYTLFGNQITTQLYYIPNPHVRIQGGMYLRKDFGNESITKVTPLFTVKFQNNGYSFIMGNLEGNVAHQLAEPVYNYERVILNHLENGLQIKIDKKKFWADTWLNWEVQEYLHSNYQEQLCVGHSSKTTLYQSASGWQVKWPAQFIVTHKGGQIDVDTTSLQTLSNAATGLCVQYENQHAAGFIKRIQSENYWIGYKDLSPSKRLAYQQGHGLFFNLNVLSHYDIGASVGYWSASHFISPRGGDLFRSVASVYGGATYTDDYRSLLFVRLFYQHRIYNALNVDVRLEPYYDIPHQYLAYSYSVYLTYKKDFTFFNLNSGKRNR